MLNNPITIITLLLLLQSCGSGSDSSNDTTTEYEFTLLAKLANQCGQQTAFDQLEVHLQDDNWQLINKYSADVNGQIHFITEQKEINYTIIAKSQQGENEEGFDIISYYHANTITPAWYKATYDSLQDNSNCECVTQDIELQHRAFSMIDSISTSFDYDNSQLIDSQTTYLSDSEVCRIADSEWPVQSISIKGLDANNNAIGVASVLENFSSNTENLLQPAAIEVADLVPLPQNHAAFELAQLFKNDEHFYAEIGEGDEELLVFNTHPYISESTYYAKTSHIYESIDTIFGRSSFSSYHQIQSNLYDEAFSVLAEIDKPTIDNTSFSELASDGSYDYSAVSGYPLVKIVFDYQLNSISSDASIPVSWTMYGPIKGTLAASVALSVMEESIGTDSNIQTTDIKIIKSSNSNNYSDYIGYYQGNTESDLADDLRYYHLQLAL